MAKQILKHLDLTTLAVALDHLEENGAAACPDPLSAPGECVYLRYIGPDQLATLAARLPHVEVVFRTVAAPPRNKVVRKVFSKPAILHLLRFPVPGRPGLCSLRPGPCRGGPQVLARAGFRQGSRAGSKEPSPTWANRPTRRGARERHLRSSNRL